MTPVRFREGWPASRCCEAGSDDVQSDGAVVDCRRRHQRHQLNSAHFPALSRPPRALRHPCGTRSTSLHPRDRLLAPCHTLRRLHPIIADVLTEPDAPSAQPSSSSHALPLPSEIRPCPSDHFPVAPAAPRRRGCPHACLVRRSQERIAGRPEGEDILRDITTSWKDPLLSVYSEARGPGGRALLCSFVGVPTLPSPLPTIRPRGYGDRPRLLFYAARRGRPEGKPAPQGVIRGRSPPQATRMRARAARRDPSPSIICGVMRRTNQQQCWRPAACWRASL